MKRVIVLWNKAVISGKVMHEMGVLFPEKWGIEAITVSMVPPCRSDFLIYDIDKLEEGDIEAIRMAVTGKPAPRTLLSSFGFMAIFVLVGIVIGRLLLQ